VATGAQAIGRIAAETGLLPATVLRAARTLREADPSLWPMAGRGGGKVAAHVEPQHLVNLGFALTVEPITDAPEAVKWLASLAPANSPEAKLQLPGKTLGDALAGLIDVLSLPSGRARPLVAQQYRGLMFVRVEVIRSGTGRPYVMLSGTILRDSGQQEWVMRRYEPDQGEIDPAAISPAPAALDHRVTIAFGFYEVCAELWADSRVHGTPARASTDPNRGRSIRRVSTRG
jgi:hypothetical protein